MSMNYGPTDSRTPALSNTNYTNSFTWMVTSDIAGGFSSGNNTAGSIAGSPITSAGAPEIDGSLAPKVGFLLGCLFLMFGRKKQNTEPMLTA